MNAKENSAGKNTAMLKNAAIGIGAIAIFIMLSSLLEAGPVKNGTPAPVFKIPVVNSRDNADIFNLKDQKGKVVILDFWSTTCPPCLAQIGVLKKLKQDYANKDLEIVGLAVGGESLLRVKQFAAQRQINYPVGPDSRGVAATAYKVSSLPTLFIVDKTGKIVDSHVGYQTEASLVSVLKKIL